MYEKLTQNMNFKGLNFGIILCSKVVDEKLTCIFRVCDKNFRRHPYHLYIGENSPQFPAYSYDSFAMLVCIDVFTLDVPIFNDRCQNNIFVNAEKLKQALRFYY